MEPVKNKFDFSCKTPPSQTKPKRDSSYVKATFRKLSEQAKTSLSWDRLSDTPERRSLMASLKDRLKPTTPGLHDAITHSLEKMTSHTSDLLNHPGTPKNFTGSTLIVACHVMEYVAVPGKIIGAFAEPLADKACHFSPLTHQVCQSVGSTVQSVIDSAHIVAVDMEKTTGVRAELITESLVDLVFMGLAHSGHHLGHGAEKVTHCAAETTKLITETHQHTKE